MAIMEGETEIFLTEQQALAENFNGVPLWIRPQSFFQTNPVVASALYATAREWAGRCRYAICGICFAVSAVLVCIVQPRR